MQDGRTLEFRADLVSSSGDGAVARLGFTLSDGSGGYIFQVDEDTVALSKRPGPLQLFLLTNGLPVDVTNVKLVVSMTGVQSNVWLQFKILDNDRAGVVLREWEFWDTPSRDPMQVGTDDPPANYLGRPGQFKLGLYHDNADLLDRVVEIPPLGEAEVVFDNVEFFEYDSVWITGPQPLACLACWSQDTAEEQIVVGANSPTSSVWTPWPEPIFKRFGELCMAVPTTNTQQFFKLVPGTQFIDDFDPLKEPFATRNPWIPWFANTADASRFTFTIANGAFQIVTQAQPVDGRVMVFPPGTGPVVRDFYASVDLLDWASSQESALGIAGRVQGGPGGVSNMYLGSLKQNPTAGTGQLWFFDGATDIPVRGGDFSLNPALDYRLEFSAVGNQLTLRLVSLAKPETLVAQGQLQDSRFSQGRVALWVNTRGSASYARTVDTFFVTGTKP